MDEEGGFGFPFGGDPEELMRGLRDPIKIGKSGALIACAGGV